MRVGHRGAPFLARENTLASLEAAVRLGLDMVEFDVLDLADGALVLAHSDDLREVSHGAADGVVRTHTLVSLREIAPDLATLDEALELLAREEVLLQVDVKWVGYEQQVAEALRRHGVVSRSLASSLFAGSLRRLGTVEPELRTAFSYPFDRHGLSLRRASLPLAYAAVRAMRASLPRRIGGMLRRAGASAATLNHAVITRATVERCRSLGAPVLAWTVDDAVERERLERLGVAAIITNDPRIFPGLQP